MCKTLAQIYLSVMVGFAYMADAMEMMILSILGPALHCEWHITGNKSLLEIEIVTLTHSSAMKEVDHILQ